MFNLSMVEIYQNVCLHVRTWVKSDQKVGHQVKLKNKFVNNLEGAIFA